MKEIDSTAKDVEGLPPSDLAHRLARYRRRVEAEGRPRSLRLIDRAIADAGKKNATGE
ncbi:hypothetical protein [Sphingomonas segetis]|jgi:hypothetical protein|uniref:hypothetical protein n=1 Tax=Sphingomonas segetis TaxID=1104779 RepID=UPI0012D2D0B6|nr:hypothetical protein [Sphingomonas segetis]